MNRRKKQREKDRKEKKKKRRKNPRGCKRKGGIGDPHFLLYNLMRKTDVCYWWL